MKSSLHKLKQIKPLIHLNRDEAILRLFKQIYSILNEELSKYTNNKFLFIPISGKHLHDLDGTKEHFFLTGAPIGIFNFENNYKKIDAIASILSYTLYNRKHGLSATNLLSELVINESKENIISFAKISFGADNILEIEKNSNPYPQAGEINFNLLNTEEWQKIKDIIKTLIFLEDDCYVKVPNLDRVLDIVPLTSIETNISNSHFEYIISNLYHFGNSSELKSNYYFPSFYFIEKENQPVSSYGFFVVSTKEEITGKDAADTLIEYLERVALVVFSLVGIIEQHYYGKIQKWKGILDSIDRHPEDLLGITQSQDYSKEGNLLAIANQRKNANDSDILKTASYRLYRKIENIIDKDNINPNIFLNFNGKKGTIKDIFLWQKHDEEITLQSIKELSKSSFVHRLNEFHYFINHTKYSKSSGERVIRHCLESFNNATDKEGFWKESRNLFMPFEDLSLAKNHPDFCETYWVHLQNSLTEKEIGTLDENGNGLQNIVSNIFHYFKRRGMAYHDYPILKNDWETIKRILSSNYKKHANCESFNNEYEIVSDTNWFTIKFKINPSPLNEEQKGGIKNACSRKEVEIEHLNHLIYLVTECYNGEIWHIAKSDSSNEIIQHKHFYEDHIIAQNIPDQLHITDSGSYCLIVLPRFLNKN